MKAWVLAAAVAAAPAPAWAHDFWLEPETFRAAPGAAVVVRPLVGHGEERRPSPLPLRRVVRFEARGPDGAPVAGLGALAASIGGLSARFAFAGPGVHTVSLDTDLGGWSQLDAARFDAHVAREGLTPAATARAGRTGEPASERYGRHAVALVQVGAADHRRSWTMTPTGATLDLVAEANPYAAPDGRPLPVRVYYEGRPLAGAKVRLTALDGDGEALVVRTTDADGRAALPWPQAGRWRITTVWTKPLPPGEAADFETVFASLSFGFDGPAP
jgi:uncharacterized GH25 family protein